MWNDARSKDYGYSFVGGLFAVLLVGGFFVLAYVTGRARPMIGCHESGYFPNRDRQLACAVRVLLTGQSADGTPAYLRTGPRASDRPAPAGQPQASSWSTSLRSRLGPLHFAGAALAMGLLALTLPSSASRPADPTAP